MTTEKEKNRAIASLREIIKAGDSICCTVMRVSKSGMSRTIMFQIALKDKNGRAYIRDISHNVAKAIGVRFDDKNHGAVLGGCGMDMRFAAVYDLGRTLFPDGFGIAGTKEGHRVRRPATAKAAAQMVRNGWVFRGRNGDSSGWDRDGGYALNYRG